jgi:DNA-binding transcriptional LysR family regulator
MITQSTLRQLRIFEAVARYGSLSRAAAELGLTQPAVSMQIKQMEDQFGMEVIERVNNKFALTDAGQELRFHAARIGTQTSDMLSAMEPFRELERGVLRIAVVSTASYFLPSLIAGFSKEFPGVRVSLNVANREAVLAAVSNKQADLAITGQPPERSDVVAQTIELELITQRLVVLRVQGFPIVRRWFILHRSDKKLSGAARAFRTLLLGPTVSKVYAGAKANCAIGG